MMLATPFESLEEFVFARGGWVIRATLPELHEGYGRGHVNSSSHYKVHLLSLKVYHIRIRS